MAILFTAKLTPQQLDFIVGDHEKRLQKVEREDVKQNTRLMGIETNIVNLGNRVKALEQNGPPPSSGGGGSNGGELGPVAQEILNAISGVEAPDGFKLDKRLDDIYNGVLDASNRLDNLAFITEKELLIPRKILTGAVAKTEYQLPVPAYGHYVAGPVTVYDLSGTRLLKIGEKPVTATITVSGKVTFDQIPYQQVTLVYILAVNLKDLPQDFLTTTIEILRSNTATLSDVLDLQNRMRQSEEALQLERITPRGLYTQAIGSTVYVTWSYEDSPDISHFVLERYDENTGEWVPFDGLYGIVLPA
ncbi:hypothetical protein MTAT_04600 [Moorella thermoacetica]|uniref:Uncharacterized protein n=1 Tax=Neomoorella thermoacetica TaxID=1525 RepID=A0AAC9HKE6_NEOTH|nr:hypothetical protein [Moorella thermoacetica]AOQ24741.1 hypothetical protein Maut_02313 [Moorella thermoacetica]TYL15721.1 hypothetical protein MTAT_04600 [Moorella thermoacetica]